MQALSTGIIFPSGHRKSIRTLCDEHELFEHLLGIKKSVQVDDGIGYNTGRVFHLARAAPLYEQSCRGAYRGLPLINLL